MHTKFDGFNRRFTPTGVGTISVAPLAFVIASVHPHGRGDNCQAKRNGHKPTGSPPRAWGQLTPRRFHQHQFPVHPHGRGDNSKYLSNASAVNGSPPRAWGQLYFYQYRPKSLRFTPTGVGTILYIYGQHIQLTVHPHGRGDNPDDPQYNFELFGSPPRAWGQCNLIFC